MTQPLVSIALCTYNGEKYLPALLDSLLGQTYPAIEIIITDDNSSDNSQSILTGYARNHHNIRLYINEVNLGFIRNFEKALSLCQGEFIALSDQDDIWEADKIELQVNAIGDNLLVYHDSEFVDENGNSLNKKLSDLFDFYRGNQPEVFLLGNFAPGHTMLFKRELLNYALPFSNDIFHDWWLAYLAANHGSVDYIPKCLVKYRQHTNNVTNLLHNKEPAAVIWTRAVRYLNHFANYKHNKNPEFVKKFAKLYFDRLNSFTSVRLMLFMSQNFDLLLYTNKQNNKRKLRYLRKLFWGYKAKNFLYQHVTGNQKKIVRLNEN